MHRPRLAMLRQATRAIHAELEGLVERQGYFDNLTHYGDYLRRLHLFYRSLEARLGGNAREWLAAWHITDRVGLLTRDLEALALEPLPGRSAEPALEPIQDRAQVLGALYVLLGASLGARVLMERTARLCAPGGAVQSYLSGVGTGTQWNCFLDCLETEPIGSTDALCRGAIETFASIREHLAGAHAQ